MMMKRGDIFFAKLDPTIGTETKKTRPVLIVSNNANNRYAETITVVPITSNVEKVYPFEVYLAEKESGLQKPSKVQCHQIRTISKLRIAGKAAGKLRLPSMRVVERALRLQLSL